MHDGAVEFQGFLGEGSSLEGDLRFAGPFRIDGRVAGRVVASAILVVGPPGEVEVSTLEADSLIVAGAVRGTVHVTRRLEILPGGVVEGRVHLRRPCLTVHPGGRVEGELDMIPTPDASDAGLAGPVLA